MTPDNVSAKFADKGAKISLSLLPRDKEEYDDCVLIEADALGLEFLGKLLLAQAKFAADCGFQLAPHSAGSALFRRSSKFGLYIHRLPCLERMGLSLTARRVHVGTRGRQNGRSPRRRT